MLLQWGRRCSSTETRLRAELGSQCCRASMGPSMFVDGDVPRHRHRADHQCASMGPSMFVDGDFVRRATLRYRCPMLQWGRRCSSTETGPRVHAARAAQLRASMGPSMFVDGDGEHALQLRIGLLEGFNGAVDVRRRRLA